MSLSTSVPFGTILEKAEEILDASCAADWLRKQGYNTYLLDATPAGAALYRQYHFVELDWARQYVCTQPRKGACFSPRVDLLTVDCLPELVAFDQRYFGSNRKRLLCAFLTDYPDRFLVKRSDRGETCGFLVAQPQRPGPYVACSVEDAVDLLDTALALDFEGEINVIAPALNPYAEELFRQYGFGFLRALPHMGWGVLHSPSRRRFIYGQASFALG
ncbi:MAG: hypothetical protein NZ840_04025 [Anaerolineales bacterium]|nr:hypothetical protein [Anaerolineales bacterium]MDW8161203.1 hypothetical protein [Anaerolineales bacterium]